MGAAKLAGRTPEQVKRGKAANLAGRTPEEAKRSKHAGLTPEQAKRTKLGNNNSGMITLGVQQPALDLPKSGRITRALQIARGSQSRSHALQIARGLKNHTSRSISRMSARRSGLTAPGSRMEASASGGSARSISCTGTASSAFTMTQGSFTRAPMNVIRRYDVR